MNSGIITKRSITEYLIRNGENIHSDNDYLLRISSEKGDIEIVKYLIKNKVNIHANNDYALRTSSENGHIDIVKYLIQKGADVHADDDYALKSSCQKGHIEIVKYLIENGADIHAENDYPLRVSSQTGHTEIVKYLVDNGANVHAENDFVLKNSSVRGYTEIVRYLVDNGADVHADNDFALINSSGAGHIEIVKYLVENGADIHAHDDHALRRSSQRGHIEIVKYLVENGANIHAYNDFALIFNTKITKYLIEKMHNDKFNGKFKKVGNKILSNIKNKNYFYKWQTLCSLKNTNTNELHEIAKLHDIDTKELSKRQICKLLAEQYDKEMNITLTCHNETTILGDSIDLIPKPLLISITEGKFTYCFNIIELMESINSGNSRNPYTRTELPIKVIKKKMVILRQILISDKLSLVNILEEIKNNEIMSKESILKLKIINLMGLLKYTPHINDIYNMDNEKIKHMFNLLNGNALMRIFGDKTLNTLINESLRVLQIEDSNSDTRKAAYEIYLNEVFSV